MHRAHKVALDVNNVQSTYLAKACGTARFAYNWALATWKEQYQACLADPGAPKPSEGSLRRLLNSTKREQFPWMTEVTKCAPQEAIIDLGKAFANFFAGRARFPVFKRKGVNDSFRVSTGQFQVDGDRIRLPRIGWVRMRERLRWPDARLESVTVSRHGDRWMVAIACEVPDAPPRADLAGTIGIDVGTSEYWTSEDEEPIMVPRAYRNAEGRLRRAQQKLSRTQKGSKNRAKAKARVARVHRQIADVRSDWLHKVTCRIANTYAMVVIEDLNVTGMTARAKPIPDPTRPGHFLPNNRKAQSGRAKSVLDAGFGEFRRQLEYKTQASRSRLIVADRWFPSTKLCSECGAKAKQPLPLTTRRWQCENCGIWHHRDKNAATNLRKYATNLNENAVSSTVSACGEFSPLASSLALPTAKPLEESGTEHQTGHDPV